MATTYYWNFGDGYTSNEENPTHIYKKPGRYTVSLTVTSDGTPETVTKTYCITVFSSSGNSHKTTRSFSLGLADMSIPVSEEAANVASASSTQTTGSENK